MNGIPVPVGCCARDQFGNNARVRGSTQEASEDESRRGCKISVRWFPRGQLSNNTPESHQANIWWQSSWHYWWIEKESSCCSAFGLKKIKSKGKVVLFLCFCFFRLSPNTDQFCNLFFSVRGQWMSWLTSFSCLFLFLYSHFSFYFIEMFLLTQMFSECSCDSR